MGCFRKKNGPIDYVFVCQAGDLEIMALLLVSSMKDALRDGQRFVAALPGPSHAMGALNDNVLHQLHEWGVDFFYFENRLFLDDAFDRYRERTKLLANKIYALDAFEPQADEVVFLDTDQILLEAIDAPECSTCSVVTRPVGWLGASSYHSKVKRLYDLVGAPIPTSMARHFVPTTKKFIDVPQGANTSWIAFDSECFDDVVRKWLQVYPDVLYAGIIEPELFVEQSTFLPAVQALSISYSLVPYFDPYCHYHGPRQLSEAPKYGNGKERAMMLAEQHGLIRDLAGSRPHWDFLTA